MKILVYIMYNSCRNVLPLGATPQVNDLPYHHSSSDEENEYTVVVQRRSKREATDTHKTADLPNLGNHQSKRDAIYANIDTIRTSQNNT